MSRRYFKTASSLLLASVVACAGSPQEPDTIVYDNRAGTGSSATSTEQKSLDEGAARDFAGADKDQQEEAAPPPSDDAPAPERRVTASVNDLPAIAAPKGDAQMDRADGLMSAPSPAKVKKEMRLRRQTRGALSQLGGTGQGQGIVGGPMLPASPPLHPSEQSVTPEPVAQDPGGTFVHAGVNPLTDTREDNLSTFAIDVDTASYTYARRFMQNGQRPGAGSVRVEEWVNAFHYEYADPSDALPFAVHLSAAPSPLVKGRHLVRVGVQGKRIDRRERKPVHLTFLVDVSGSMTSPDKLPLAQRSLHMLTNELNEHDSVAIVTYAGSTGEVLKATKASRQGKQRIHDAIERLTSGGGTNMGSGMELAYRNAHRFLSSDTISRVIVLSDGDANIGNTSHQDILKSIKGYVSEGVTMSTIGFGTGNYQDHLMEQLANAGNGNYAYIDSEKAAHKAFVDDLTGTLQVIAKDVKIQVDFDKEHVAAYRLIGYENRDVADKDFRNDRVDAGEIGAGHTVTALYEVVLRDSDRVGSLGEIATVRLRHKTPRGVKATEIARTLTGAQVKDRFGDLDHNTRFATAAALSAEILRGSEHVAHKTLEDARAIAAEACVGKYAEERKELVQLLSKVIENRPAYSQR